MMRPDDCRGSQTEPDTTWKFALDMRRPSRGEFMPTETASWPAQITAGVCDCCHYPAAVIEWHAVPSRRDFMHARDTVRALWASLGLRGQPRAMIGSERASFVTGRCREILARSRTAPPRGSDEVLREGTPLGRCDFCGTPDTDPPTFRFWPADDVRLPHGPLSEGAWAACPACSALVAATRWDDLVERITRRQVSERPEEQLLVDPVPGHEAKVAATIREHVRQTIEAFRRARRVDEAPG